MKTKHIILFSMLGIMVYLIMLVAKLPATQVLHRVLPQNVVMENITGTVWNGKSDSININGITMDSVKWNVSLLALFSGKLGVNIQAGNVTNQQQLSIRGYAAIAVNQKIYADNLVVRGPARLLAAYVPMPLPVKLDGQLRVNLANAVFNQQVCETLNGKGYWNNAAVSGTKGWIDLGAFSTELGCEQQHITANITPPNQFNLTAKAKVSPQQKISAEGSFKPDDSLPKEVHQAAMLFGAADPQGFYQFKF